MNTTHDGLAEKLNSLEVSSTSTSSPRRASPALTHRTVPSIHELNLDLTLPTAVSFLIHHLTQCLTRLYPPHTLSELRLRLTNSLTDLYEPTWDVKQPHRASGYRSLICTRSLGLPKVLGQAAAEVGVSEKVWRGALARRNERDEEGITKGDEWEAWCDPGTVVWRFGSWEWEDVGFDPYKLGREPFKVLWSASSSPKPQAPTARAAESTTPARPSYAIPIRAPVALPAVFAIPPTPAAPLDTSGVVPDQPRPASPLLPAVALSRTPSPSNSSGYDSSSQIGYAQNQSRVGSNSTSVSSKPSSRASHRGTGSTDSTASSASENSGAQLLTPNSRPPSVDPFSSDKSSKSITPTAHGRHRSPSPASPRHSGATPTAMTSSTPTITPYDGGNVTVLGGGVKLGGPSRSASVMSAGRTYHDRSRSPSVSNASRALNSATGVGASGQPRKTRTRRRIMPTYLGHLGQPMPAFSPFVPAIQPNWPVGSGVGVGMGPPPVPGMTRPLGQPRVSSI